MIIHKIEDIYQRIYLNKVKMKSKIKNYSNIFFRNQNDLEKKLVYCDWKMKNKNKFFEIKP